MTEEQLLFAGLQHLIHTENSLGLDIIMYTDSIKSQSHLLDLIIIDGDLDFEKNPVFNKRMLTRVRRKYPHVPIVLYANNKIAKSNIISSQDKGINAVIYKNASDACNKLLAYIKLLIEHPSIIVRDNFDPLNTLNFNDVELDVLNLICKGKKNREIAKTLNLSIPSIENYISKLYEKLEVNSRVEAAIKAITLNLVFLNLNNSPSTINH